MNIFYFTLISLILTVNLKTPEIQKSKLILSENISSSKYDNLVKYITQYQDHLAVSVVPLDNSEYFYLNNSVSFVSASMIKLLILAEFVKQIDDKTITLDQNYIYKIEDKVGGSGIIQDMAIGTNFTYDILALYMIKYSDNIATNVLIDILGMENINYACKRFNLTDTSLNRKMMNWTGVENYISARDTEILLKAIYYKNIGSEKMSDKALEYLKSNADYKGIAEGIPSGIVYAHKTGELDNVRHDGGIVYAKNKYIIIVLTKDYEYNFANQIMKEISKIAYSITNKGSFWKNNWSLNLILFLILISIW